MSYVFLSALPTVPGSGCRVGGALDRAAAEERDAEDVGVAVGARFGGIAVQAYDFVGGGEVLRLRRGLNCLLA